MVREGANEKWISLGWVKNQLRGRYYWRRRGFDLFEGDQHHEVLHVVTFIARLTRSVGQFHEVDGIHGADVDFSLSIEVWGKEFLKGWRSVWR